MDLVRWLSNNSETKDFFLHIHNENDLGDAKRGYQRKLMGVRKGVSDFFLALPRGSTTSERSSYHGLWIELKRRSGGSLSESQKIWIERMQKVGYAARVCLGFDHAVRTVEAYLRLEKKADSSGE